MNYAVYTEKDWKGQIKRTYLMVDILGERIEPHKGTYYLVESVAPYHRFEVHHNDIYWAKGMPQGGKEL